ncbi:MAG: LemA family protein [Actinomycetota bacterium]
MPTSGPRHDPRNVSRGTGHPRGDAGAVGKPLIIGGAVVGVLLLFFVLPVIGTYNRLVTLREGVEGAWAQVESVYQRRADLIPNLAATVQASARFEQETLVKVTEARTRAVTAAREIQESPESQEALDTFEQAQNGLGTAITIAVEAYPDIKSTQNFLSFQDELAGTENRIAVERMRYNEAARDYNVASSRFPANIAAALFGFEEKPLFRGQEGSENAPDVGELFEPTPTPGG